MRSGQLQEGAKKCQRVPQSVPQSVPKRALAVNDSRGRLKDPGLALQLDLAGAQSCVNSWADGKAARVPKSAQSVRRRREGVPQ